jgi:hypothetical protein
VRRSGPAKQRLWLGSHRYRRCGRDAFTNCNPESYTNSNRYTFGMRPDGVTNTDGNGNRDSYSDAYGYSYRNGDSYTYFHTEVSPNSKTASHASAAAIDFPYQKFPSLGPAD